MFALTKLQWIILIIIIGAIIYVVSTSNKVVLSGIINGVTSGIRGIRNNNPGNVESPAGTWQGQTGNDGVYSVFDTPVNGIKALGITAIHYQTEDGIQSLTDFGNRWAPASDNNGQSNYGTNLASQIGVDPDQYFDVQNNLIAVVNAIIINENGINPYSDTTISQGANAALAGA